MVLWLVVDGGAVVDNHEVSAVQDFGGIGREVFEEFPDALDLLRFVAEKVRDVGEPNVRGGLYVVFHDAGAMECANFS